MTSAQATSDYLDRAAANNPAINADFTIRGWFRVNSYSMGDFSSLFRSVDGTSFSEAFGIAIRNNGVIRAFVYRDLGGGSNTHEIFTGSDTDWHFYALTHDGGTTNYTFYWRDEGEASLNSQVISAPGSVELTLATTAGIFIDADAAPDAQGRAFCWTDTLIDEATLLTLSTSLTTPAGSPHTFLDLDSATNVEVNLGTGANYVVHGTFGTAGDEPDASLGGGGGTDTTDHHVSTLSFPALCRRPRNDNGKWTRSQGGLYVPKRAA